MSGNTKWKIQTTSVNGWADIKVSVDGGPYVDEHFDTEAGALKSWKLLFDDPDYRVVSADTRSDDNLY